MHLRFRFSLHVFSVVKIELFHCRCAFLLRLIFRTSLRENEFYEFHASFTDNPVETVTIILYLMNDSVCGCARSFTPIRKEINNSLSQNVYNRYLIWIISVPSRVLDLHSRTLRESMKLISSNRCYWIFELVRVKSRKGSSLMSFTMM